MKGLLTPLALGRFLASGNKWDGKTYVLLKPMKYVTSAQVMHIVPKGFITDCASWVRRRGRFEEAAVMHDYLYRTQAGRHYADRVFKEMMTRAVCPRWRINMFYYGVRLFGWWAYYLTKRT